ncbi:MAG: TonB-dependent receptor [Saprospiraceae bacterium]|nr:TonB-dependent receptor [Saprospiraceae bacterium]
MKQNFVILLLTVLSFTAFGQRMVKGKVSDATGSPLIGANVLVKEVPSVGTITDVDGMYELQVPNGGANLVFSYTGFDTKEVAIGSSSMIDVTMAEGKILDEVVIIGYGSQAKKDVTGSISKVTGETVANLVSPSFVQQLAGRAAGVQVQNTSGILGSAPQVRIRGVNSISSGTQPLYVVDGVPVFSGDLGGFTSNNALGDINSNDIESYEILKDGAASAIYGSRAANGVVLITTKKGAAGKAKFNYDVNFGVAKAAKLFDLLGAQDFVTIQNEKYTNAGANPVAKLQTRADGSTVDTDWQGLTFRSAVQHSHNLSVSGGVDKTNYFFSFGYADQEGIVLSNALQRYSFRANIEQKVNTWLTVGFKSGVTRQSNQGPLTGSNNLSGNVFGTIRMLPNVEALDPTHPTGYNIDLINIRSLGRGANGDVISNGIPNQLFVLENDKRQSDSWRLLGNAYLDVKLMDGLNFKSLLGIDGSYITDFLFQDPRHGDGLSANGRVSQAYSPATRWNWQNILSYNKEFGDHNLGVTLVQEYQKQRSTFFQSQVTNISDLYFQENIVSGTFATPEAFGGISENGLASYLGRVNYNFAGKYYLSGSIRRDELSALAPGNRVGYFPGVSFAYRISEESYWESLKDVISDFRLRGSFAQTGNTNIGNYPYVGSYGSGLYGAQNGIAYNNFGNDLLKWESQTKTDFGFDLGLKDNRYNLSVAYWIQDNDDIILQAPTAPSLGVPNNFINKNIGRVKSSGIELSLDANLVRKSNFKWNVNANFSTQKNEVLTLVNGQDITTAYNIIREGESIRSIYGYNYRGVNAANGNPIYETYNRDADGNITETILVQADLTKQAYYVYNADNPTDLSTVRALSATRDRVILGSALPTWFGGLENNLSFGNFDVNFLIRFSGGNKIMNRTRADLMGMTFNNNSTEILGRWQSPENPGDGQTPRLFLNRDALVNNPDFASTRWVEDGDFVRLQNLSLSYRFSESSLKSLGLSSARVYVQGQNLVTLSGYSGLDPETSTAFSTNTGFGEDFNGNPQQRVYSVGLNVGF